ncbi:GNAT family N-acetyltransferase [Bacillus alkalicellulosilyticus]|uniref:GNAT family N-acetyltransferase n=1 Tax=Alkalihalobacterium alkalicellulosilyticum TaxID=1912214 RepID=UPI0009981C21|nr:GNAT family N-acetyltransferase [Bacillus alkalicellulosilyticus]
MLLKYKSSFKKIAMGLISYMPSEKDVKKLQETIDKYEASDEWELYLWKEDVIVGVIGIRLMADGNAELCHLSVNPSFREEGIGKKMIHAVKNKVTGELLPNQYTKDFLINVELKQ